MPFIIASVIILVLAIAILGAAYYAYSITFKRSKTPPSGVPERAGYEKYKEMLERGKEEIISTPHKEHRINAYDGTGLFGRFYDFYGKDAPIAIMMHGYHGSSARDFSKGFFVAKEYGMNILLIDQRAHGKSGGAATTFGYKESRDCRSWCEYIVSLYPKNQIVLFGVSMGASSILQASVLKLPDNVRAAVADCPFMSAKEIIKKIISDIGMPAYLIYPLVYLGALIFGRFDLKKASVIDNISRTKLPTLIFHGDKDSLVPYRMSSIIFDRINAKKDILIVEGAEHAMSCLIAPEEYKAKTYAFLDEVLHSAT